MKQGRASSNVSDPKTEPIAHKVNVGAVSQLGAHQSSPPPPLESGRGFMAPAPVACTVHKSGSQRGK